MAKSGSGEFQRKGVWIGALADVLPVEEILTELPVPARRIRADVGTREAVGCRVCQREEGSLLVARIPRPPADPDLFGVASVAHDEVVRRWICRLSREEVHGEVEGPP